MEGITLNFLQIVGQPKPLFVYIFALGSVFATALTARSVESSCNVTSLVDSITTASNDAWQRSHSGSGPDAFILSAHSRVLPSRRRLDKRKTRKARQNPSG